MRGFLRAGMLAVVALFAGATHAAEPLRLPGIENGFDLGGGVLSGGSPVGEAAFAELVRRGVKTMVSVDGSPPDLVAAHRFGLRYVHLPIGYDGISSGRANELAKVATAFPGPIFVHCHHGKHRGPAAAAILCAIRDGWNAQQGQAWLREAGTAPEYDGLYQSVRTFHRPGPEALSAISAEFPERAAPPPLVDAMVSIDAQLDELKSARANGWETAPGPAAALLWEQLRELSRDGSVQKESAEFQRILTTSEQAAAALRDLLREPGGDAALRDGALERVVATCTDCHREYRNRRPAR